MSLWNWLEGGFSMPRRETWGQRLALWVGYRMAIRHRRVTIDPSCAISPEARVHPRQGAIEIGAHSTLALGAIVQGNVRIGTRCSVQARSILVGYGTHEDCAGRIMLGDAVRIAPHVLVFAANHNFDDATRPIHGQGLSPAPITIEDDVWIGSQSVVTAGVTIGKGAVIGAGSVVTKSIAPYSVAVGVPARVIKSRL